MTSKVTSATVSEVKFASETENIKTLSLSDIKEGFAGCDGKGIPMTSANFNAVLNWIAENIGLEEDIVVETIDNKKYLVTKAKDGSKAKIELSMLIENILGEGLGLKDGKLFVKTTRFVDASGTVLLGYGVDKEQANDTIL